MADYKLSATIAWILFAIFFTAFLGFLIWFFVSSKIIKNLPCNGQEFAIPPDCKICSDNGELTEVSKDKFECVCTPNFTGKVCNIPV